jgi:soluble lytic murein transglycosylase
MIFEHAIAYSSPDKEDFSTMSPVRSTSLFPRLIFAAALLLPVACSANEFSADQAAWYRTQLGLASPGSAPVATHPVGEALMQWKRLSAAPNVDFFEAAQFLIIHPGWPEADKLRRKAEAAIPLDGGDPILVTRFFDSGAPLTPAGHVRHAIALAKTGRTAESQAAVLRAWNSGPLDPADEARVRSQFGPILTRGAEDARMDRLLWSGAVSAAARQLAYVTPDKQPYYAARVAMRSGGADAAAKAAYAESIDPALTRRDPGYIVDKATWLRKSGRGDDARALLAHNRTLDRLPTDPEEWLETLLTNAKAAVSAGENQRAFDIARQLDDIFAPGTVIANLPQSVRDDYSNLAWLAGTVALNRLGRPGEAAQIFNRYASAARAPGIRSKGFYWAGKAAQMAGDRTAANGYFEAAARDFEQFYGQLAIERIGRRQPVMPPPPTVELPRAELDSFANSSEVRTIKALGQMGAWKDQTLFLRAMALDARTPSEHYLAAQLSQQIGRPDLGVMIGRSATINGIHDLGAVSYPVLTVPDGHKGNWTFIHAITRQESQFDRQAQSHAGARGLMQLMPSTAREVAGKLGLSYELSALTSDPQYNITLGSTYFQQVLSYFNGSYPLAVAAYNAGPGNVNRWLRANGDPRTGAIDMVDWIEAIPIFETRNYVQRVLENAVVYDTMHPDQARSLPKAPLNFYLGRSPDR